MWQREGVRPAAGEVAPQKHRVGCLCGASQFPGRNWFPLGFWLGNGRGRWRCQAPLFPTKLSFVVRGSTTLPPVVLQPSRSLSRAVSLYPPDVKSRLLSEHTLSVLPLRFCKPDSGALLAQRAAPLPRLPPASPWSAHRLTALPTLFRGPLVCAWLRRLRSANPLAFFWVI